MKTEEQLFKQIVTLLEKNEKVALCTLIKKVGSGPRKPGAKMIIAESGEATGTIGGGSFERELIHQANTALSEGKSKKIIFSLDKTNRKGRVKTGLICGGELTIFIDIIKPRPRLIIIGAGHIAYALAKLAGILSFTIIVVDDKKSLANQKRFPMANRIIASNFDAAFNELRIVSSDIIVIVHGEAEQEYKILKKVIKCRPAYIGLLGSKKKTTILLNRLREAGADDESVNQIHAPIGLEIGAQTPEEIGISILAEIIDSTRE